MISRDVSNATVKVEGAPLGDRDYYEVLGVPADADHKTVDEAYWSLVRETVKLLDTRPAALRDLNEAYECLSIPDLRARYDASRYVPSGEPPVVPEGDGLPRQHGWRLRLPWRSTSGEEEAAATAIIIERLAGQVRAERERWRATISADVDADD